MAQIKLTAKAERTMETRYLIRALKAAGFGVANKGEYKKWKELSDGSKLSVTMTIYEVKTPENGTFYFLSDTLGRVALQMMPDITLADITAWLAEHGYKTEKRFCIEDCGMSESTWAEWNKDND